MKAVVWSKPACPYCEKAKNLLKNKGIEYEEKNIAEGYKIQDLLELVPNARTMPQIWLDEEHIGGYFELEKKLGQLTDTNRQFKINTNKENYDQRSVD